MKYIELNGLIRTGNFYPGLDVGLTKKEIGKILEKPLLIPDFITPDLDYYFIELKTGLVLSILFDKEEICFEINLDSEENKNSDLIVQLDQQIEKIDQNISFEKLIEIIQRLNLEWEFDKERMFLQTICLRLNHGLRLYYAFGNKSENDYGLFSIRLILESHKLISIANITD